MFRFVSSNLAKTSSPDASRHFCNTGKKKKKVDIVSIRFSNYRIVGDLINQTICSMYMCICSDKKLKHLDLL